MSQRFPTLLALFALFTATLAPTHAQDTAFVYQGELRRSGAPADGPYDFTVGLFLSETGGNAVDLISLDDIAVDRGRFALTLDFTDVPFQSGPTWLEIRVRSGSETGSYTALSPRQRVAPVPYSITSLGVAENAIDANAIDDQQVQRRVIGSCPPGSTLIGIQANGELDCEPLPLSVSIALDEVGLDHDKTSIAVRPDGRPVISYYDSVNQDLKLYDCLDTACITGLARTLDSNGDVGRGSSVAIHDDGTPIVSYYDATNTNFKVFACADAGCTQGTSATPFPSLLADGRETAIAIRGNGLPIIAYVGASSDLGIFTCDNRSCSGLFPGTANLFSSGSVSDLDIAIRADGRTLISYMNPDVMVWLCNSSDCADGSAKLIDNQQFSPAGPIRDQTAIAFDNLGFPVIAYGASASGAAVFRCSNLFCNDGSSLPLDTSEISASDVDLAFSPEGVRLISHADNSNDNLQLLACAASGCGLTLSGRTYTRQTIAGTVIPVRTSIAVRPDGSPVISFIDRMRNRLMIHSCGSPSCGN